MANTELINGVYHTSYRDIGGGGGGTPNAVQYVPQTLTNAQKAQARTNIGGASSADLSQTNTALGNLSGLVGGLQSEVELFAHPTYVTAWDGESAPVVANIPDGVVVTYDGTDYTGTLAASASTTNKIYLVSTGTTDEYYRYVTGQSGSTYSWAPLGSTEMDLSDYATKSEVSALDRKSSIVYGKFPYAFNSATLTPSVSNEVLVISVSPGDYVEFTHADGQAWIVYGILKTLPDFNSGSSIDLTSYFVDGGGRVATNSAYNVTVPSDGVAIVIQGDAREPKKILVNKVDAYKVPRAQMTELSGKVATIDGRTTILEQDVEQFDNAVFAPEVTYDKDDTESGYYVLSGETAVGPAANAGWKYLRLSVKRGDSVDVYTRGGGTDARAYALTDKDGTILVVAAPSTDTRTSGAVLSVAVDGYLYVNCDATYASTFKVVVARTRIYTSIPTDVHAPRMFNPKADLTKQGLRILDIGNSYTNDATHYLSDIISAAGITAEGFSHYKAIRSLGSFKTWVDCFNDEDTAVYSIGKVAGDDAAGVETGEGAIGNGGKFRTALAAGWDIILIHQVSIYANDYAAWQGSGNGGYLRELIRVIRQSNPNASIGFLLVHSYTDNYSGNTEGSAELRWQNIAESAENLVANYGIDFVIPYGTAVQNLRESTIAEGKNAFSSDGSHLANGIGDYVAGACYFQMVYAPRFGKCIIGNTFRKTDLDETETGVLNIDNTNAPLAQKAAFAAAYDWYNLHNPDDL